MKTAEQIKAIIQEFNAARRAYHFSRTKENEIRLKVARAAFEALNK